MSLNLNEVETFEEAAKQWGLEVSDLYKNAMEKENRLIWKKSGEVNLIVRKSMDETFGTILEQILNGRHKDPEYGILTLIERGEITVELLRKAGVKDELIIALKDKK